MKNRRLVAGWKALTGVLVLAAITWFGLFGNPQWHPWIYRMQWKVFGQEPRRPDSYSGIWRQWTLDEGLLLSAQQYRDGVLDGASVEYYYPSGSLLSEANYERGIPMGVARDYHDAAPGCEPSMSSLWEYSRTGYVVTMFSEGGDKCRDVVVDRIRREKVIREWSADGTVLATTTVDLSGGIAIGSDRFNPRGP